MIHYKAPVRDIDFVISELLEAHEMFDSLAPYVSVTADVTASILEEAAKFAEAELVPLYRSGDEDGAQWTEDGVVTPAGYREAWRKFVENGWPTLGANAEYGGQGMPYLVDCMMTEVFATACTPWFMYHGLTQGAIKTIATYGEQAHKESFLPNMVAGRWSGTMCLTEPQCGSDLGLVRTKAEPRADGSYSITGTKIFISGGEHDMVENIVHVVLARLPDSPAGTKGLSLFIVPKIDICGLNPAGVRNAVYCPSIEKKMGLHAASTCVLNFDDARGYLLGPANKGLACMFTFMNFARIGAGFQGLSAAELSLQGARGYARERLAMRSLTGPKNPGGPADPIIVHPDVRRMLLTQKAIVEGSRALLYFLALQEDIAANGDSEPADKAKALASLLTPIGKAFVTEVGCEAANLGVQVFGGHGFIRDSGMEQIVRDSRISTLYEGTTGIQALDLLGRKVLGSGGLLLSVFTDLVLGFCDRHKAASDQEFIEPLRGYIEEWLLLSQQIMEAATVDAEEVGSASVDFLMYSGYVTVAYFWARMAVLAREKIQAGEGEPSFYDAKLSTARFYFQRLLPRASFHKTCIDSGARSLMEVSEQAFAF